MQWTTLMAFITALCGGEGLYQGGHELPPFEKVIRKQAVMRKINILIIHCSATKAGMDIGAAEIDRWHRQRGYTGIGYHYVIRLDGRVEQGREVALAGAHCRGWNERSIGICYVGGLDAEGNPADTRTEAQKAALKRLIEELRRTYPIEQVIGHRDVSPDRNGNGVVEPSEFMKACPCFDVKAWLLLLGLLLCLVVGLAGCGSHRSQMKSRSEQVTDSVVNRRRNVETDLRLARQQVEQCDERVEELICVTKRVIDRRKAGAEQLSERRRSTAADSLLSVYHSSALTERQDKSRKEPPGWIGKVLIGIVLLALLFVALKKAASRK